VPANERQPYEPNPVPQGDLHGFLADELKRLADALNPDPVFMVLHHDSTINVGTTPDTSWIGSGTAAQIDKPGSTWNSTTYTYTVPQDGYYYWSIMVAITGTSGGQDATYTVQVYKGGVAYGDPITEIAPSNDTLRLYGDDLHKLVQGDAFTFELTASKASGTTNSAAYAAHIIFMYEAKP